MNYQNQKYLHISQHWGSKRGIKQGSDFVYINPVSDQGKRSLSHLKDLELLIEFHGWNDNGVYYNFSDSSEASWGQEVYSVEIDGTLIFKNSNYDSSD